MNPFLAAASAVAMVTVFGPAAHAQVAAPATPRVGTPIAGRPMGPPAPSPRTDLPLASPRDGPLPASLTLEQALDEAEARAPAIVAARAGVAAAEARIRQAGVRSNPEISVEVENFAGTGEFNGTRGLETTVALNQRLDLGGRRRSRVGVARAELAAALLRLQIMRADLARDVRVQFARSITARDRLVLARDNDLRARELARIAGQLVDAGRDPPLRGLRARSAASQVAAELLAAQAEEEASRRTLASLFGVTAPPARLVGGLLDLQPGTLDPEHSLDVRLADAERLAAEADVAQQLAARNLDPAIGIGVRQFRGSGDVALVGGISMPLPVFDRNQGNIAAARADVIGAEARRASVLASVTMRARNAIAAVDAAHARVRALEGAAIPEAFEALQLGRISYREGRASLLELLDAQNAYTAAEGALIDARLALALATAELGRVAAR